MTVNCVLHPYRPAYNRPPKGDCVICWASYGRIAAKRFAGTQATSVGRARGGGQSSKAKGRTAAVLVRSLLLRSLTLADEDVLVKATSMGGVDLHLSPLALSLFPFSIEVKNVEALNIWQALKQAAANASPSRPPVVFFKRASSPMYVAVDATDFLSWRA